MTLLIDPFPANHYSAFPICAPFSVLSILTILLDKCHMKSFENIKILIKVKVFCLKKNLKKLLFLKKNCHLKPKKFFLGKTLFLKKIAKKILEKNFFTSGVFFTSGTSLAASKHSCLKSYGRGQTYKRHPLQAQVAPPVSSGDAT